MLGVYQVFMPNRGGGSFRVEEYKKPEFEVNVEAPTDAGDARREGVGDHQGEVLFRRAGRRGEGQVQDHPHDGRRAVVSRRSLGLAVRPGLLVVRRRFVVVSRLVALGHAPARRLRGGDVPRRLPKWWPRPSVPIRPDGTLPVEIDTALAKAAHPDQDQRYEITAEITDQSRRTIVGTGTVLVARKPFTRLYLGRSRPLPRGRHDRGGHPCADPRPQAGRRQGDAQAAQDRLRRRAPAGRDARGELGPGARRRRSGPPDDQGVGRRASTGWRRRSTTARAT